MIISLYHLFYWALADYSFIVLSVLLEGARASTGLSMLCVDVGYKHWSNDRPICA